MDAPHRRFELTIQIGADSINDIIGALNDISFSIARWEYEGLQARQESVSGGPSSRYTIEMVHDPEMTHERYFELIDEFLGHCKRIPDGG